MITFDFFLIKFMECVVFLFSFVYGDKIKSEAVILYIDEESELMQTQLFTSLGFHLCLCVRSITTASLACSREPLLHPTWRMHEFQHLLLTRFATTSSSWVLTPLCHLLLTRSTTATSSWDLTLWPSHEICHLLVLGSCASFTADTSLARAAMELGVCPIGIRLKLLIGVIGRGGANLELGRQPWLWN